MTAPSSPINEFWPAAIDEDTWCCCSRLRCNRHKLSLQSACERLDRLEKSFAALYAARALQPQQQPLHNITALHNSDYNLDDDNSVSVLWPPNDSVASASSMPTTAPPTNTAPTSTNIVVETLGEYDFAVRLLVASLSMLLPRCSVVYVGRGRSVARYARSRSATSTCDGTSRAPNTSST